MTLYLNSFEILNNSFGIEDYEQKGEHFFPEDYRKGKSKRFHIWHNGCGIGRTNTITEAREMLFGYATSMIINKQNCLKKELKEVEKILSSLGDDSFNLGKFIKER